MVIKIGELRIKINCCYGHRSFDDFLCLDNDYDFELTVDDVMINNKARELNTSSLSYAEFVCIHELLAEKLPLYDCLLSHGACINYRGRGYLFMAPSGTGKTTHIRHWLNNTDCVVVNGDKPILKIDDSGVIVYGNPWNGKEHLGSNTSVVLDSIVILKRGDANSINRVRASDCIMDIMRQFYSPKTIIGINKSVDLINRLFSSVKLYELYCTKDEGSFLVSYRGLINDEG